MSTENKIQDLLDAISQNEKYNGCVFEGPGIYFVIGNKSELQFEARFCFAQCGLFAPKVGDLTYIL